MLLTVNNLSKRYTIEAGLFNPVKTSVPALCNASFSLAPATTLGVVGETGSGKTTLAKLLAGLLRPTQGSIAYALTNTRKDVQMVFQDPFASLNPRLPIRSILEEPLRIHRICSDNNAQYTITEILQSVGMPSSCVYKYPNEMSGGQRQRIAIARSICVHPKLLICDEPTSALDVSVQAQILNLLLDLKEKLRLSYVFISHNIEVISLLADEVLVLYKGHVIERGLKDQVIAQSAHPYTQLLLDPTKAIGTKRQEGDLGDGCAFVDQCPFQNHQCHQTIPPETEITPHHFVACHYAQKN